MTGSRYLGRATRWHISYWHISYGILVIDGVQVLVHVFEQEREAVDDRHLQLLEEVGVVERARPAVEVLPLALLDPADRLHLRVDAEREARRARGEDAILHRELVRRQRLRLPLHDLDLGRQQRLESERLGDRDRAINNVPHPPVKAITIQAITNTP